MKSIPPSRGIASPRSLRRTISGDTLYEQTVCPKYFSPSTSFSYVLEPRNIQFGLEGCGRCSADHKQKCGKFEGGAPLRPHLRWINICLFEYCPSGLGWIGDQNEYIFNYLESQTQPAFSLPFPTDAGHYSDTFTFRLEINH